VLRELDLSSLLDGKGEVDKGRCCPKEEHSWINVVRPLGHDSRLEVGSCGGRLVEHEDEGDEGWWTNVLGVGSHGGLMIGLDGSCVGVRLDDGGYS